MASDVFSPKHKFQDDVWGQINLNDVERDVVDAPEFQRLFRTSQLGFVNLVYPTANHTRGAHSIGACHAASLLADHLVENTRKLYATNKTKYAPFEISRAEMMLIRLGALLHDISHVPLSHDVERKTHKIVGENGAEAVKVRSNYGHYDKHDDYYANPLLYLVLFDRRLSVLARILARYSTKFHELLLSHDKDDRYVHLLNFINLLRHVDHHSWNPDSELLPSLLFHLLTYETPGDAKTPSRRIAVGYADEEKSEWSLGPPELAPDLHRHWYQQFRHDIIGNTLSADLIDYLRRDSRRLGIQQRVDLHLLNYYVLVRSSDEGGDPNRQPEHSGAAVNPVYRCAIDVDDSKRGTTRTTLVNDVFGLLSNRYVIHEKAVMHRVVQSATAMLSRALMLLGDRRPGLQRLVRLGEDVHALQSEPLLLLQLLDCCKVSESDSHLDRVRSHEARELILKLVDRRVYRPLMIIPGDRAARRLYSAGPMEGDRREYFLRTLAAIVESPYYSPFLLFVSACVEKYLQGALGPVEKVCEYIGRVADDGDLIEHAMRVIPSRVILSASPYKQLYKDPAVVVALPDWNGRIDELATKGRREATVGDETLFDLVGASIAEADVKYAALWKLYVFVSDGLYYTGLLNKLRSREEGNGRPASAVDAHEHSLKQSQLFVLAALNVVVEDWFAHCRSPNELCNAERRATLGARLQARLSKEEFRTVARLWRAKYEHLRTQEAPLKGLSTVSISQYVHSDPLVDHTETRCRDIRYKSDTTVSDWTAYSDAAEREVVEFLKANGIAENTPISHREFQELTRRYEAARAMFLDPAKPLDEDTRPIDLLWLMDFPIPHLRGTTSKEPKEPKTRETLPPDPTFLQSGEAIRKWLRRDAMRQLKNVRVRRQLEAETNSVAAFLEGIAVEERRQVFTDLQTRLDNESLILMNDIKEGQIMHYLRQKWGHLLSGPKPSL